MTGTPAALPASHRRRSRRRQSPSNGRRRTPRTALAVCCTALAAGAGGVFSGVIPLPPGVPASVVVAGDPAGHRPLGSPGPGSTGAPGSGNPGSPGTPGSPGSPGSQSDPAGPVPVGSGATGSTPTGGGGTGGTARPTAPAGPGGPTAVPSPGLTPTATASAPTASGSAAASPTATAGPTVLPTTDPVTERTVLTAQSQVLALVNTARKAAGCGALTASPALTTLAQDFSVEMDARSFFNHTDPNGRNPWDRAKALGITDLGGENIAMGQPTPQDVMTAWLNSPGHRANILNCSYHSLGVGVQYATGQGPWWTQDFGF